VKKSDGTKYILSNDHVLGRPTSLNKNSAAVGDPIVQPNSCNPYRTAAKFSFAPTLSSGVDAAIAQLVSGTMNSTGQISGIGVPASTTIAATVGMKVAKSGAATGVTCGQVQGVMQKFQAIMEPDCEVAPAFPAAFNNVIAISPASFATGGDSGALIVSTSKAQPTALLFGGGPTTFAYGFAINSVLSAVGGVTIVGGAGGAVTACPVSAATKEAPLSAAMMDKATAASERYIQTSASDPAVIAVGVGRSATDPAASAVLILIDKQQKHRPIPSAIDGVPTRVIYTDPIRIKARCPASAPAPAESVLH